MGRDVKRVPLDFDWPMHCIWPGYMIGICTETIKSCVRVIDECKEDEDACKWCRKFGKLANLEIKYKCPNTRIEVPKGDGYQMWETTSEGSPISPVFKTPEELAHWLEDNEVSTFADMTTTYDNWLNMIKQGSAPSAAIIDNRGLISGVDAVCDMKKKET